MARTRSSTQPRRTPGRKRLPPMEAPIRLTSVEEELEATLGALNSDEELDLIALMWFGRGDFTSFAQAREEAEEMRDKHIASYLMGTPKLGDFLEEGLSQLGYSLQDFEKNRL